MSTRMFGGVVFNDENASVHSVKQLNSRTSQPLKQSINQPLGNPIKPSLNPSNKLSVRRGLVDITNKNNANDSGPSKGSASINKPVLKPRLNQSLNQLKPSFSKPINQTATKPTQSLELEHCHPSEPELPMIDEDGLSANEIGRLVDRLIDHDRVMNQAHREQLEYPSINQMSEIANDPSINDDISPEDLAAIEAIITEDFDLDF